MTRGLVDDSHVRVPYNLEIPAASILGHRSLPMPLFAFGRQKMARRQGLRRPHPLGLRADERQVATAAAPGVAVRSPTTRVPTPDCPPISSETAHAVPVSSLVCRFPAPSATNSPCEPQGHGPSVSTMMPSSLPSLPRMIYRCHLGYVDIQVWIRETGFPFNEEPRPNGPPSVTRKL